MNKVHLTGLKIKAFRSFVNSTDVGELPLTGLIGIKGLSGSGKTSLPLAIFYALGYCPLPATELQSWPWLTEEPMQVELTLSTPQGEVIRKRGEVNSVTVGGVTTTGASASEQELQKILKIKTDLLEALTFREQRKPGRFLSMSDSQKKEFLSQLLELDEIENQIYKYNKIAEKLKEKADAHDLIVTTLTGQLVEPTAPDLEDTRALEATLMRLDALVKANTIQYNTLYQALKAEKAEVDKKVNSLANELASKMDEVPEHLAGADTNYRLVSNEFLALKADIEILEKKTQWANMDKVKAEEKLKMVMRDLEGMKERKCPTCNQYWSSDSVDTFGLHQIQHELETKINQWENVPSFEDKKTKLRELQEKLWQLQKTLANRQEEIQSRNNQLKLDYLGKTKAINQEFEVKNKASLELLSSLSQDPTKDEKNKVGEKLRLIWNSNKFRQERFNSEKAQYDTLFQKIVKEQDARDDLNLHAKVELDYVETLKAFLGSIFDEVLYEISTEANEYLKSLPNVESVTVEFITERTTQKGNTKQEIKALANKNGNKVSLRSLSGGQQSAIELAVDLAVATVVGRRTGIFFGFMVLDESFDGMDMPTKESCLELLKIASKDRLIFMIDHSTEIKEYFDKYITVENNNDISTLRTSSGRQGHIET